MELRSEESIDIKPYTHSRLVEKVVVSLGEDIAKVKNSFLKVQEHFYLNLEMFILFTDWDLH